MDILIKNGRLIDPANNIDGIRDVYVKNGKVAAVGEHLNIEAGKIIDAKDKWVVPGLIDLHTHLRDPGLTYKEDIASGSEAAAKGGFTTICAMPNTRPVMDRAGIVKETYERIKTEAKVDVLIIGSTTKGQKGKKLTNIEKMVKAGICAVSEDGYSVLDSLLMKKALAACADAGVPFFDHCEDLSLVDGGVINAGPAAVKYNLPGISNDSESVIVARDIILSKSTGAKLHLCHLSAKDSVDILRTAKNMGIPVTGEVCPHHFTLSHSDIDSDDGKYKMNPPLRSECDVKALISGLKDNTIEVIATDHAPHSAEDKAGGFLKAANGITGLETALPLCITELTDKGHLSPSELIAKLTVNPARILNVDKGHLSIGARADITVIDVCTEYEISADSFVSKGKNTPFHGRKVKGAAAVVIKAGVVIIESIKEVLV